MRRRGSTVPARAFAIATSAALIASVAVVVAPVGASPTSVAAVANTLPGWLARAVNLGAPNSAASVDARVYLAPRGGIAALERVAMAVSTPGDPSYGKFFTTAQYQARYAPTAATVSQVTSWLTKAGLAVTAVGAGNEYLVVHGSVPAANRAFRASIARFRHDGVTVQAPSRVLTVPATLASSVLTITGVDTTPRMMTPRRTAKITYPKGFRNARPCSAYFGEKKATYKVDGKTKLPLFSGEVLSYAPCGYVGKQLRRAYEGTSTLNGSGVTVAITDAYASPSIASDANTYAVKHGDGAYTSGQLTQASHGTFRHTSADACDQLGWWGEETLDVEAVHAMAPKAKIRYYPANSCLDSDLLDTLTRVVNDNKASIVTNSWGGFESDGDAATDAAYHALFVRAASQGISFLFSSGDGGDEFANAGRRVANYPASDPYVTAVGGTSAGIGSRSTMGFQTGWGDNKYALSATGKSWQLDSFLYGSGGGPSHKYGKPSYQMFIAPGLTRQVPDVAMDADPSTGMLIGQTQKFPSGTTYGEYRIGGTSLAAPLLAGMTALTLQHAHKRAGLLNPALYSMRATVINDIQGPARYPGVVRVDYLNGVDSSKGLEYSVRTMNTDSSLRVKLGWDPVTGLGAPRGAWLTALG